MFAKLSTARHHNYAIRDSAKEFNRVSNQTLVTRACALYVDSSELSIVLSMKVCSLNDIHFLGHISTAPDESVFSFDHDLQLPIIIDHSNDSASLVGQHG